MFPICKIRRTLLFLSWLSKEIKFINGYEAFRYWDEKHTDAHTVVN